MSVDAIIEQANIEKAKSGRPPYEANDFDEGQLSALLAVGFPHRQISLYMHKDIKTLRKHYPELFEVNSKEDKTALVENALWYNAVYRHNVVAQLAWLKAHKHDVYGDKSKENNDNNQDHESYLKDLANTLPD